MFCQSNCKVIIPISLQLENDVATLTRQLDELRTQNSNLKKTAASAKSEHHKVDELQRKINAQNDSTMKLKKTQQDLKKVCDRRASSIFHSKLLSWLHNCKMLAFANFSGA